MDTENSTIEQLIDNGHHESEDLSGHGEICAAERRNVALITGISGQVSSDLMHQAPNTLVIDLSVKQAHYRSLVLLENKTVDFKL
jgi:hypothetical protein